MEVVDEGRLALVNEAKEGGLGVLRYTWFNKFEKKEEKLFIPVEIQEIEDYKHSKKFVVRELGTTRLYKAVLIPDFIKSGIKEDVVMDLAGF